MTKEVSKVEPASNEPRGHEEKVVRLLSLDRLSLKRSKEKGFIIYLRVFMLSSEGLDEISGHSNKGNRLSLALLVLSIFLCLIHGILCA